MNSLDLIKDSHKTPIGNKVTSYYSERITHLENLSKKLINENKAVLMLLSAAKKASEGNGGALKQAIKNIDHEKLAHAEKAGK